MCTNGGLDDYEFDADKRSLFVRWTEDSESEASTILFVPWLSQLQTEADDTVSLDIERIEDSNAGWVVVAPRGDGQTRELSLKFRKSQ